MVIKLLLTEYLSMGDHQTLRDVPKDICNDKLYLVLQVDGTGIKLKAFPSGGGTGERLLPPAPPHSRPASKLSNYRPASATSFSDISQQQ